MLCRRWDDGEINNWHTGQTLPMASAWDKGGGTAEAADARASGQCGRIPAYPPLCPRSPLIPEGLCGRHSPPYRTSRRRPHLGLALPDWLSISPAISGLVRFSSDSGVSLGNFCRLSGSITSSLKRASPFLGPTSFQGLGSSSGHKCRLALLNFMGETTLLDAEFRFVRLLVPGAGFDTC